MIPGGRLQTLPTRVGSHWLSPQNQRYSINLGGLQADLKGGSGGAEPPPDGATSGPRGILSNQQIEIESTSIVV